VGSRPTRFVRGGGGGCVSGHFGRALLSAWSNRSHSMSELSGCHSIKCLLVHARLKFATDVALDELLDDPLDGVQIINV